jgi:hypothetical protein
MALQSVVHNIDTGVMAKTLKIGMLTALLIGLCVVFFLMHFKGLGNEQAMDQAQIARSVISGEGFSTKYIRPLAIRQLNESGKKITRGNFPEFYNAPLFPLVEAVALFPLKNHLEMASTETLFKGDRVIAVLGIVLMLAGVLVWYFVGSILFDQKLALLGSGLLLITNLMWQFALSGLPQHLLIIFFGLVTLCALLARNAETSENSLHAHLWLAGAAFGLGLMSLTSGVTAFLLPGFLAFCLISFQTRISSFLIPLAVYLVTISPWLIHNYLVCGNPLGLAIHTIFSGAGISESMVMRGVNTSLTLGGGLIGKLRMGLMDQAGNLWEYFGLNVMVAAFLVSLLHPFRNPVTSLWRWMVLIMWVGAAIGMSLFGVSEVISGNQIHFIFLPIAVFYGLAFLLVLWNRLEINLNPLRVLFLTLIFAVTGIPLMLTLLAGQSAKIQWPPYVPPFISLLQNWFKPQEILSSDMPWAVAWYANRKCLLLPETVRQFNEVSDFGALGSSIVGLYLTPVSGSASFLSIIKGPYKEWAPVIMRTVNLNDFLLKSFTPLPIDGECILYADSDRWARKFSKPNR